MRYLLPTLRGFCFLFVCLSAVSISAQSVDTSTSFSTALNSNGSIKPDAVGSFDPSGYRMTSGPNGEPRFVAAPSPAGACPDNWDTTFTPNGANNDVNVIVSDGGGNIYIGGSFTSVQGVPINGIAKWDGIQWSGLGNGINGEVKAIAISGTDIYVGGGFGTAGGNPAKNVAKWSGGTWSALGAGLGGGTHDVEALAILGADVYIGGSFNTADGSPANGLVRWAGGSYSAVGLSGQVYSLAVSGGNLYVGGFVGVIADPTLGGLIKWDGMNWSGFGLTASNTTVRAIGINGTDIYVGGLIRRPGSSDTHIAKWNGTAWTSLGFFQNSPAIRAFAFSGTDVYAGGTFERSGGIGIGNGILKYNGSQWSAIGSGTELGSHTVSAIYVSGNTFYIGGDFQLAGGVGAKNLATLTNGTMWAAAFPGTGLDSAANAIAVSGADVYVGGSFISAGPVTANKIAKWNSTTNTWSALGSGISGFNTEFSSISTIAVGGGKVYVGGRFSQIGGITASGIAVWNGTNWAPLGAGVTGANALVTAIVVQGDELIVGGDFTTAGGVSANRIAKWNGTSWSAFGGTPPIPNTVTGIAFLGSDMYVSSGTTTVDNPNYLLKYDGTTWTGLAPGMGGHGLTSVVALGSDIYVSGGFTAVGGVSANRVAKWNGSAWSALGAGLPSDGTFGIGQVFLGTSGGELIASGNFTVASGGPADRIARWNGSSWSTLGNGLNAPASKIVAAGGDVFVGGGFTTAGCNQSPYLARWRETVWTGTTNSDWHTGTNWGSGTVPVASAGVSILSNNATISSADVTVSSLIISNGRTLTVGAGRTLTVTGTLDLNNASLGGPGTLVVGDLSLNNGNVTGLGSVTVNGNLYLNGGNISGNGPVAVTACRTGAIVGGNSASLVSSPLTRCVNSSGSYRFPVGTGSVYAPITLSNIVGNGNFTVEPKAGEYTGAAADLPVNRLQRWWDLTNGGITQADITFNYLDSEVVGLEEAYRVYRISGGVAEQVPAVFNTTANTATVAGVTSFSPWTLAEAPASVVSVGGKIRRPDGRPIPFITVTMTDSFGGSWTTVSKHSGLYHFDNLVSPRQYTLTVTPRKRAMFSAPQRLLTVSENLANVDFVTSTP